MENETGSASSSALAWRWTIEALASFDQVKPSLLHELLDGKRNNAGEMVALKCLEGLFRPLDDIGENSRPAQESKVMFDSSESCLDVVKRIYNETPKSALGVAGPDMLKWDVKPFIDQKRASMRCTLLQLKDSILDGTHPYADFLMQKSGLTPINKKDGTSLNNVDCVQLDRRLDNNSSSSQGKKEGKGSPPLEDERRMSVVTPSSSSLLPSKRSSIDFTSEDEARQVPGCDDGFINVKKLKHHSAHNLYSGQEVASSHGTEVVEDSSDERSELQIERDDTDHLDRHQITLEEDKLVEEEGFGSKKSAQFTATDEDSSERSGLQIGRDDTDHLDRHQINLVEDKLVEEEHSGSKNGAQCTATDELHLGESGIPCYTVLGSTQDGEMLEVVDAKKVGDGSELPFEPKAPNHSPAEENLDNSSPNNSESNFRHDHHVNETNPVSHSGFLSTTVATYSDVGMIPDEEEKDMSSDSDGYHETIDIAMRKKEFLSSQCMVDSDSFLVADRTDLTVCVKCNEGGQLLSCNIGDCPLVVHAKCLGSLAAMNDEGDFRCPFCLYSFAISEYLEAKKHAALAKKNVTSFFRSDLVHHSIGFKEVLQPKNLDPSQRAGVEDVAKICEDVDMENKDNQVTLDGEHVSEVVDHRSTEQTIELSKQMDIANTNHRENESSLSRVAPDVLSSEKDDNGFVDQECPRNTAAELVDQECHGNTAVELVDQESEGNAAELEDGENATKQHGIHEILHEDRGPVEPAAVQEDLQYQTNDNKDEATCAIITEEEKSSDDGNDESIISRYSIRFRQKYHHTSSETHPLRRKKLL
ncbi:hypothetical protein Csa_000883 [Cucumis sativus]|nr:hypothetical protein Csa_000883 [Cucumis sativus]